MLDSLIYYYSTFPSVRYATIVLVLVSICASLLGVVLVLKRFSMIGDGLSHVAFGATSIATAASFTPMFVALPFTVAAAILLLRMRVNKRVQGDAAIAMISAASLAIGYMILNLAPSSSSSVSGDACASLFGSATIIGINMNDVWLYLALALVVILVFIIFYNKIFAITFDEGFSNATGIKVELYNLLISVITGVVIVISMKMVGALLISALITFPALSSMRLFKTFKAVIISSVTISLSCAIVGVLICVLSATPVGPTIAVVNTSVFLAFYLISFIKERKK